DDPNQRMTEEFAIVALHSFRGEDAFNAHSPAVIVGIAVVDLFQVAENDVETSDLGAFVRAEAVVTLPASVDAELKMNVVLQEKIEDAIRDDRAVRRDRHQYLAAAGDRLQI